MNANQLRTLIIRPTILRLGIPFTNASEDLLIGTAAVESKLGHYIAQIKGPAKGIYQIEPASHRDLLMWCEKRKPEIYAKLFDITTPIWKKSPDDEMVFNLYYATAMCRLFYLRVPEPIPESLELQAAYWKRYYNTALGKGTAQKYIDAYLTYGSAVT